MREEYTAMHGLKLSTQQEPTTRLFAAAQKRCDKERPPNNIIINFKNCSATSAETSHTIAPNRVFNLSFRTIM